jgi:hypothetical protein
LPPLSWQPSSSQLPPPQSPNAVALSAAIAAAVAITHLFDIAIERRWCGWTSDGDYGDGDGEKTRNGDGNEVVGNEEGDGNSGKSNDDGDDEGKFVGGKGDGDGEQRGQR